MKYKDKMHITKCINNHKIMNKNNFITQESRNNQHHGGSVIKPQFLSAVGFAPSY